MITDVEAAAEARLINDLAAQIWLGSDTIQAMAPVGQLDQERYRVRGLDDAGAPLPPSRLERGVENLESWFFDDGGRGYLAVKGEHPNCAAVGCYQGARFDHAWLVITSQRVAVLRLRDRQNTHEGNTDQLIEQVKQERSLGGALRGIGKIVKSSATEFAKSVKRPPLTERPQDVLLDFPFSAPRNILQSITRWKQPLVPEFSGGPRFIQVHFNDGSWARVKTHKAGLTTLTGEN